jgi:hypothetical protein
MLGGSGDLNASAYQRHETAPVGLENAMRLVS